MEDLESINIIPIELTSQIETSDHKQRKIFISAGEIASLKSVNDLVLMLSEEDKKDDFKEKQF